MRVKPFFLCVEYINVVFWVISVLYYPSLVDTIRILHKKSCSWILIKQRRGTQPSPSPLIYILKEVEICYGDFWNWLGVVDDLRTFKWVESVPYPQLTFKESEELLRVVG